MTKSEKIVGLIGLPNSGKTTIFNLLTGLHQRTGNWPGVTVEKKSGFIVGENYFIEIIDLPGIVGLSPNSIDEKIAVDFIVSKIANGYLVIIDALNLKRGLYLLSQLMELELPLIVVLNMMDKAEDLEISIDLKMLEDLIGVKVFPSVALKEIGIDEIKKAIINGDFKISKKKVNYGEDFEGLIKEIEKILAENFNGKIKNKRFFALKILEEDQTFWQMLEEKEEKKKLKNLIESKSITFCKKFNYKDLSEYIAEKRYGFAEGILNEIYKDYSIRSKIQISNQIDLIFTHKLFGIPIFFIILYFLFSAIYYVGNPFGEFMRDIFNFFSIFFKNSFSFYKFPKIFSSFIVDGILTGVGTVISFFPNIFLLYFFISILEDSGYFMRVSFLFDKVMHYIGLHGKAILPIILGFGCNVPAITGTRILEEERDRILTILIIPFISCSARLPIYVLFAGIFFPENEAVIILSLYLLSFIFSVISAKFYQKFLIKKPLSALIMELPPYHIPSIKGALIHSWIRSKEFLKKASTIILFGILMIWALGNLPPGVEYGGKDSWAGLIGNFFSKFLKPLGFGFWQAGVALLFGIVAKEIVVGTFSVLFSPNPLQEILPLYFTKTSAFSFMLISLIYTPCLSTLSVIKREAGLKYALISIIYSILLGWILSFLFYQSVSFIKIYPLK